ncbi:MAG: carboxy terminal-processing peptidase [Ignavibacterium sp.]|jgi:carboxyl-terminal processing protease|nr:carboxy terminal-processing peptidase [Ignavibacterium sp.]
MVNTHRKKIKSAIFIIILFISSSLFSGNAFASTLSFQPNDTVKVIKPENHHQIENQFITSILTRYHFKEFEINDSLSNMIFNRYLEALDNGKNYFLASDIESFNTQQFQLDDNLYKGDIQFYYDVFNAYINRVNERMRFVDELLDKEFDYSADENYEYDRNKSEWAKNQAELNELWRKRLKNDALTYKLNGKNWEYIQNTLKKRYKNFAKFLNQYNSEDVFQLAMNSFTQSIDPHTNYLSPVTSDNFKIDMSLSLEGIGARLQTEDDYTKVAEVIPGGPAAKSGLLKADDKIIGVAQGEKGEFEDIIGWRITDAVKLIRGEKGTLVRLQIIKAGSDLNSTPIEISLIREKVKLEDQAAKGSVLEIMNEEKPFRIGVIDIPNFYIDFEGQRNGDGNYRSTTKDVKKILDSLKAENVDGIIIDLREDGGGSLQEAIELTGLFIKDGPVVQVKNSDGSIDVADDPDPSIFYDGPLAVLVNRYSASASEIFSGAIQDYGRGLVIGEQTFGKGTVQNLIDLNRLSSKKNLNLGQVKLTIAKYYRVNGGSTQSLGVVPDISYPTMIDPEDFGESSEPTALPWDEIKSANFNIFSDLAKFLPELNKKHLQRISDNKDFQYLIEDIEIYKENKKKTFISLNEEIRKQEKEKEELRKLERKGTTENQADTELMDEEIPVTRKDNNDYILEETAKIISDFIIMSVG